MRSTEECVARIAARGRISQKEASDLLQDLYDRSERMRETGEGDPIFAAAAEMAMGLRDQAKANLAARIRDADARSAMMARAIAEAGGEVQAARGLTRLIPGIKVTGVVDGLKSMMHWVAGAQAKDNAETMWTALYRSTAAAVQNKLRQEGVLKAARRMRGRPLEGEVAEAIWRANGGAEDTRVTISSVAQKIADALQPSMEFMRQRLNAEGARIGKAMDYVAHNWDARQLRKAAGPGAGIDAAFRAWLERDGPRIAEKTFDDLVPNEGETSEEAKERFLRSVFMSRASGIRLRQPHETGGMGADESGYIPYAFEGTHNIARSVSQPRVVFWNNSGDWLAHMREFGGGDGLLSQFDRAIQTGSRKTALMHYFGHNPEANLNMVIRKFQEDFRRNEDLASLDSFNAQIPSLQNTMRRLTGALNMPLQADHAAAFESLMSLESAAHLGGVSITHTFAAPATISGEMVHHGVPRWETMRDLAAAILTGKGSAERQEALADMGAYMHGWGNALARAGGPNGNGFPGFVSWATAHFYRFTGITNIIDRFQAQAVKSVLSSRLGRAAEAGLDEMEAHQQDLMRRYGIGNAEWDLIREAPDPARIDGQRWVTPNDALVADPAKVEQLLRGQGLISETATPEQIATAVGRKQWDMADRLGMYLDDAADHAVVRPGVRERAMVLGSSRPGDFGYMLRRALVQFKMWPLAAMHQGIAREVAMSLSGKEATFNIGAIIALATIGGMGRMIVNDLASGNAQRDYTNPMTLVAALAQGGGLGIYADFLFGETSRLGAGGVATIMGPLGSDFDKVMRMFSDFKVELKEHPEKAWSHLWPDLSRFVIHLVPFANLVYLKGALDYLAWYHIYDTASPGWWERTNRRLMKETGRTMAGYTPGAGVPWTPWGIGATAH